MDDASPELAVGFTIDTGGSFERLRQLQAAMDTTEGRMVSQAASIEKATGSMVSTVGATAKISTFGNAHDRVTQNVVRDYSRIEKSGERLVRQLERENAAFGKSRSELRQVKAEEEALAAERVGNSDLARRIREQETELWGKEAFAARQAAIARANAAEDAAAAEVRALATVNAQLIERNRLEAALERTMGKDRPRATDAGATYSALAARAAEEETIAKNAAAAATERLAQEHAALAAAVQGSHAAQMADAAAAERLRAATDPLYAATSRLNAEIAESTRLYYAGATAPTEYARQQEVLTGRLRDVERQHSTLGRSFTAVGTSGKLAGHQLTNVAFQAQDLGLQMVAAANSSAPLQMAFMALIQQGSQVSGIMMQSGMGAGQFAKQVLVAAKLIKVTSDATLTATAAGLSAHARTAAAELARAEAAGAAALAEVALAEAAYAAAAGTNAEAAALLRLAAARQAAAGATAEATAATAALKLANDAAATSARAAAAAEVVALAPLAIALAAVAAVAGVAALGIGALQHEANEGNDMKKYAASLGLTAKEIRQLDDVHVTFGDTAKAVFQVAGKAIWDEFGPAITGVWTTMKEWLDWIAPKVKGVANFMIGAFIGSYRAIVQTWNLFPAALGDLFVQAVNKAIEGINWLIKKSIEGINWMVDQANKILPDDWKLSHVAARGISEIENQYDGAARRVADVWRKEVGGAIGVDYVGKISSAVTGQAVRNSQNRVKGQAEEKGMFDPDKGKTDKHGEQLTREAEAVEAQIRNLYALADAYGVSGAAALIAEARVKAESEAIKKRGDIEAMVDRQVRLSIAQRVSDASKSTAAMREQAEAQKRVNAMVAAGIIPADRAAQMVKDQIADLPLLDALGAARQRNQADEVVRVTKALEQQRAVREDLRKAEVTAQFDLDMAGGANRLAVLREEIRLVGATNEERARALAILEATQYAQAHQFDPTQTEQYVRQQVEIADTTAKLAADQRAYNDELTFSADKWDILAQNVQRAAGGMADAFGSAGRAIGDLASIFANFHANRERMELEHERKLAEVAGHEAEIARENARFKLATATTQIGMYGDMAVAARGFFSEGSKGYAAMTKAVQVFRAVEFALSVRAMSQDALSTAKAVVNGAIRIAKLAAEGIAAQAKLPFPLNIAAMAATAAALVAIGASVAGSFGGGTKPKAANDGTGTVLGDAAAKSESIKRSIDALKEVDTIMLIYSREMASSLRSIDSQIGGFTSVILRGGDINASDGVAQGFKPNMIGSVLGAIPLIGGLLKGLFGSTTTVTGSGLYGGPQSIGSILSGGFDASTYSDIQKKSKFLGITTGTKYSTQYGAADPGLENQFTLILRSFNDAILAAAGPLGAATGDIQARLNSFVVSIGKIDLKGLTGEQIEERLAAIFGAAADQMAAAAFPGFERFQQAGEGMFETLVRVASTVETVTASLDQLGFGARALGIEAKLGIAKQFESLSAMTSAADAYFRSYYTKEEQAAATAAQFAKVFQSLGMSMPSSLTAFRALVEAQDLTTAAGQATYATLLQLAPAFAELQNTMAGAKSAADVLSERQDLQRRILELQGDTQALRALDLAKLDASNRGLQEQIWAMEAAQDAVKSAQDLKDAWASVGDSIMDEVKRIRGLTGGDGEGNFASLMGQFNASLAAARSGDLEAAKGLPGLSQSLLRAAELQATSRQELDRIRAQTAASLESIMATVNGAGSAPLAKTADALLANMAGSAAINLDSRPANDDTAAAIDQLRDELDATRKELSSALVAIASNTGKTARVLDAVTQQSGGDALSTVLSA